MHGDPAFKLTEAGSSTHIEVHFLLKDGKSAKFHTHHNLLGDHKIKVGEEVFKMSEGEVLECNLVIQDN